MPKKKGDPGRLSQCIAHHALLLCILETTAQLIHISRDVVLQEFEQNEKSILDQEKDNLLRSARLITKHPHELDGFDEAMGYAISILASDPKNIEYLRPAAAQAAQIITNQLVEKAQVLMEG